MTFTAVEANREYPDAEVSWDDWCRDMRQCMSRMSETGRAATLRLMTDDELAHWLACVETEEAAC